MATFVKLADTLVDDYDVVELLQTLVDACRDILGSSAAGILLADETGALEVMASTSEASRLVEVMQLSAYAGPCIECFRQGKPVSVPSIADSPDEWDAFRRSALDQGFQSVEAIPLRLRDVTIGALNMLRSELGPADADDLLAARAFADVATIGILHERSFRHAESLREQLQSALNSRVLIEQAKGVVAFTHGVSIPEAFEMIRAHARRHQRTLRDIAAGLVDRTLALDDGGKLPRTQEQREA